MIRSTTLFLALALAGSVQAQTLLSEDFSAGVPPSGWIHTNDSGIGWLWDDAGLQAWHDDEVIGTADNSLVTPVLDLERMSKVWLHFDGKTNYADFMANHPFSVGDGVNTVEISLDGGTSWTVVWTDTTEDNLKPYKAHVDLSAYAGSLLFEIRFHYYGTFAQEWFIDNVVVDDTPPAPIYSNTGLYAGVGVTLTVTGATPSSPVALAYSLTGPGPTATIYGMVDLSPPIISIPPITADAAGTATKDTFVPMAALGIMIYSQGVDLTTGTLSNSLAQLVL